MTTNTVLLLRACNADGTSYGGFQWPTEVGSVVKAPDWNPKPDCGNGLHGLLWGCGDADLLSRDSAAIWMVVEADADSVVDIKGKVKVPECAVRFVGGRDDAVAYLEANGAADKAVAFAARTGGDRSTLTGGDWSTLTGGDWSTLTLSYWDGARKRLVTAYVGEGGIKPNTPYRLNGNRQFEEVARAVEGGAA